jgi:hypothetical protein
MASQPLFISVQPFCEHFQLLISRLASQHAHRHQVTHAIDVAKDVAKKEKVAPVRSNYSARINNERQYRGDTQ